MYEAELRLIDVAVDSGFESVWTLEHHFTDYVAEPDPLQLLTWVAARHPQVRVATSVIVVPWHDPVRCAERIAQLDILSGGRLIIGLGRGISRYEFEGLRVDMESSRDRFRVYATMILDALRTGYIEADHPLIHQPRREIRPRPCYPIDGRVFGAAMSPESMPMMAELGLGIFVIPQKPWETVRADFEAFGAAWQQHRPGPVPPPIASGQVVISADRHRAEELASRYIGGYYHTVMEHYGFAAGAHRGVRSFEFYDRIAQYIDRHGADGAVADYVNLHPWGTPDDVLSKLSYLREHVGVSGFAGCFSFAGIPYDEAASGIRLFATEVLPVLKTWAAEEIAMPGPDHGAAVAKGPS